MIPKKIHYCWFGGNPLPEWATQYINSWTKFCPDYDIIQWDETNYDVNKIDYMKQAYQLKKWGFVPDYARLDIIYNHGGVYLDVDVEIIKPFDDLLKENGFAGFESVKFVALGLGFGAEKGNPVIKEMMEQYERMSFINDDGTLNLLASPSYSSDILKKMGYELNGKYQKGENFTIYPTDFFCPQDYETGVMRITDNTYSIHHYAATWHTFWDKAVISIERCENKSGIEHKIRRCISFPLRVANKINKIGIKRTVGFIVEKYIKRTKARR